MKKILVFLILLIIPFNVFADEIDINSNNAILYNLDNNEILYEKNKDDKVLIASLTKIMTSIVAIENISDFNEKVIITNEILSPLAYDLSKAGFEVNEEVTYNDLLYGSLLPSGADATHSLAIFLSGSEENFVELMNQKAKELGMNNTHFENSIGIETENNNHYSSAEDMAKLLKYCIENKKFLEVFTTNKYVTSNGKHEFTSSKYKAEKKNAKDFSIIKGSKTGYTDLAGLCLASISSKDSPKLLLITIGANPDTDSIGHFNDTEKIYDYFYKNYEYINILKKGKILDLVTVYDNPVTINQVKNVSKYIKKDIELTYEYKGEKVLNKGTKSGDKIGTYYVKNGDDILYQEDIYSPVTVNFKLSVSQKVIIITVLTLIVLFKIVLKKIYKKC